jgi:hypothetical protein
MGKPQHDRVTIDLRGLREPLQTRALVNQMTPAALVRQAVLAYLAPKSGEQKPVLCFFGSPTEFADCSSVATSLGTACPLAFR